MPPMCDALIFERARDGFGLRDAAAAPGAARTGAVRPDDIPGPIMRALAVALAFVIAFSVVASSFTVAGDFHHHHTGEGCAACAQIAGCLHMARVGATLAAVSTALAIGQALPCPSALGEEHRRRTCSALVHLKVQLND